MDLPGRPAGLVAPTCTTISGLATTIYIPRLLESNNDRYGLFGVTVALVGWVLCISFIVVAASVVAAELDRHPEPWAQRLRLRLGIDGSPVPEDASRPAQGLQ